MAPGVKDALKFAVGLEVGGRFIGYEKEVELASLSNFFTPPFSPGAQLSIFGSPTWRSGTIPG